MKKLEIEEIESSGGIIPSPLLHSQVPIIIRNVNMGECVEKWSDTEYFISKAGDRFLPVHVASTPNLDFLQKNFAYRKMKIGELIRKCKEPVSENEENCFYLRSVAENERKGIARLENDFPELSPDFSVPDAISQESVFSSILRIASAQTQIWTHYDVMSNVLFQVVGTKDVTLFPPSNLPYLYLQGDKSRISDPSQVDTELYPLLNNATQYSGRLNPGDALVIPVLWFHSTTAITFSIGVNVFWKDCDESFYDKKVSICTKVRNMYCTVPFIKDLYGNKDPVPVQRAEQSLQKALQHLSSLPQPFQSFYAQKFVHKIKENFDLT